MKFSLLAVIGGILIQQYAEAIFDPKFSLLGAPMQPNNGYPVPFHQPFSISLMMAKPPLSPMVVSKFTKRKRFPPQIWPGNPWKKYRQMLPSFDRPMPSHHMNSLQIPNAIHHAVKIRQGGIRPFKMNPYGYGHQINTRIPYSPGGAFWYEGRNEYNNIYERNQNTGYSDNNFTNNFRNYNSNLNLRRPKVPSFNPGAWNYIGNTGKSLSHRNWNEPRLQEVIDSANRIQISKNSLEAKRLDGPVKTQSRKKEMISM